MKRAILTALLLALYTFPASATLISVEMTGAVTSVEIPLGAEFSSGEAITFSYVFDTETPDTNSTDEQGTYLSTIKSASVLIGDYNLTAVGAGNIFIRDGAFGQDLYGVLIEDPIFAATRSGAILQGDPVADLNPFAIVATLRDTDAEVYSSDTLPTSFPDLSLFEVIEFELAFAEEILSGRATGTSRVYGSIETAVIVPEPTPASEPTTLVLLGLGLAGLGFARKRKLRQIRPTAA